MARLGFAYVGPRFPTKAEVRAWLRWHSKYLPETIAVIVVEVYDPKSGALDFSQGLG